VANQLSPSKTIRYPAPIRAIMPNFTVAQLHLDVPHGSVPLPMLHAPTSPAAASFRVLAQRLQREGDPRVIAVTSALPREGKTSCAANLALALAERGKTVLLMETNRQRPGLARAFDFDVPACFEAQLLSSLGSDNPEWWTTAVAFESLHVLALDRDAKSGRPVNPRAYRSLFSQARERYRHVIVDCSAVSDGGDLGATEDLCDGVLLTALGGATKRRDVRAALEQLQPAHLLGVVLMNAEV
jgi:Mrp family chromosome partitioning ATPase